MMSRLSRRIVSVCLAVLLAGCGGTLDDEKRQEFIDKCTIEAGPHTDKNNVHEYCLAKWRQSQREK